MQEIINLALYAQVVIEHIAIEVAKFRDVLLWDKALKRCSNVGLDKDSVWENDKVLKMLYKEHNFPIVYVSSYQNYVTFSICPVKMGIKVA